MDSRNTRYALEKRIVFDAAAVSTAMEASAVVDDTALDTLSSDLANGSTEQATQKLVDTLTAPTSGVTERVVAPVAMNDQVTTNEDTPITIDVLANDTDTDGDALTVVDVRSEGIIGYTLQIGGPDNNIPTFVLTNTSTNVEITGFTFTVGDSNFNFDFIQDVVESDIIFSVNGLELSQNNSGNGGLRTEMLDVSFEGFDAGNSFQFTADVDPDSVDIAVDFQTVFFNNGDAQNSVITVNFSNGSQLSTAISEMPVADNNGNYLFSQDVGANGTAVINDDNTITFTPAPDFNGTAILEYDVADTEGFISTAQISIEVLPVNDAPVANDESVTLNEDTPVTLDVLANDIDVDGDELTVVSVQQPMNGVVVLNADQTLTYTPTSNFNGMDSFTYTIIDAEDVESTATVNLNILPVNDAPVAVDDIASFSEAVEGVITVDVIANDIDVDGDALMLNGFGAGTGYTLQIGGPDNNIPTFVLTNTSTTSASITNFTFTVGDSNFNFDFIQDVISSGIIFTANGLELSQNNSGNGGLRTEMLDISFEGFDAGNSFQFTADVDPDSVDIVTDFQNIFFNNGDANNSTVTVSFSDGSQLSMPLTEIPVPDNNGNYLFVQDSPTGVIEDELGTFIFNDDNTISFIPNQNFTDQASIEYTVSDGNGGSDVGIFTIVENTAPVANDDFVETLEDTAITVDVRANDSDVDEDALTVSLVDGPANGMLMLNDDGSFTYTPNQDFNGTDSFVYQVDDGNGGIATATATITVDPVNDDPIAADDSIMLDEDTSATFDVLENDMDVDGDMLTASVVTGPANGQLLMNEGGSFTYTPVLNFNGEDSFVYQIDDGNGGMASATVTLVVNPVNDDPVANDDIYQFNQDTTLNVDAASGVLSNDADIDGDMLTAMLLEGPANGELSFNDDGSFSYTPVAGFSGTDSFTYQADDGNGGMAAAMVTLTVDRVNQTPVAQNDTYTTNEDSSLSVSAAAGVLANDSDPDSEVLTASLVSGPANGALTLNADGSFTYTPNDDFNGTDSFIYQIVDADGATATATAMISVNAVNDAPVAVDDSFMMAAGTQLSDNVITNDFDVDGDALTASLQSAPENGILTFNSDGTFTYTASVDFSGTDTFTYTISDGNGAMDTATVTLNIDPVITQDGSTRTTDTLSTDTEVPFGTIISFTQGQNGSVTQVDDDTLSYTPNTGFVGTDSYTYTVLDQQGNQFTTLVTVNVFPQIVTQVWTGAAGDGDFFNPDNWDLNLSPADGDSVIIPDQPGDITLTGSDITLETLTLSDTLFLSGASMTVTGDMTIQPGGVLDIGAGQTITVSDGTLTNNGTIQGQGGIDVSVNANLINNGLLGPGNSPGRLSINGDVTLTESGTIDFEIGGFAPRTGFDQIFASGTATLNGTIVVRFIDGVNSIPDGTNLQLLQAGSIVGNPTLILPDGLSLNIFTGQVSFNAGGPGTDGMTGGGTGGGDTGGVSPFNDADTGSGGTSGFGNVQTTGDVTPSLEQNGFDLSLLGNSRILNNFLDEPGNPFFYSTNWSQILQSLVVALNTNSYDYLAQFESLLRDNPSAAGSYEKSLEEELDEEARRFDDSQREILEILLNAEEVMLCEG